MKALMIANIVCWTGIFMLVVFNIIPVTKLNYLLSLIGCVSTSIAGTITANKD